MVLTRLLQRCQVPQILQILCLMLTGIVNFASTIVYSLLYFGTFSVILKMAKA